ncbi:hypothetical protein [Pelistega ratti]|uniref:hypothetical protein n=1 Tax=Pelistega ratti TaxID=2652177 RepID=UPI00135AC538|nr:hypothetical protein [Pelistega ratti]
MKKIIIFFSLFLTACFSNFNKPVRITTFYNFCKNDIRLHLRKGSDFQSTTIQPEKSVFFYGSNKDDNFFYISNGKEYNFSVYQNSSESNKAYIACPENNETIK